MPTDPETPAVPSAPTAPGDAARAGRGVLYIAFAKFYFMVAGAVLELRLPSILGNVVYGSYGVVNSLVSPLNNVLVTGTIQTVSRFTSQRPEQSSAVQRAGLKLHLYFGLVLAVVFAACSPLTARLFYDRDKTAPIMMAAVIIAAYSFYAVFVGTANGRRAFHKQALLDVCFATLRVTAILGMAMAGFGVFGAISGWAGAACVILLLSTFVVGRPGKRAPGEEAMPLRPMASFFSRVAVYLILLNFIMVADQLLLARLGAEWFAEHGGGALEVLHRSMPDGLLASFTHVDPADAADGQVGYYRAIQTLARLAYQAIIAATFVIFPLISRSTFENDQEGTTRYIHTTLRYALIFASAIAVTLAANPQPMLDLPFPSDFAEVGWPALIALAVGNVAFSFFVIVGTILNGAGMTREAIWIAGVTLACATVSNALIIPRFVPGQGLLLACGVATGTSMVIGAVLSHLVLKRKLGASLPLPSAVRVALEFAVAVGFGHVVPMTGPLGALFEAAAVGLVFLIGLVILGELSRRDLNALRDVVRRKTGGRK